MTTKAIKTKEECRGNQYAQVKKHSRVERYYSLQLADGSVICDDWFLTLRGAKFAARLADAGMTEDQLNFVDADEIAAKAWFGLKEGRQERMDAEVARVVAEYTK